MFTTNSISRPTDPLFTTASLSASVASVTTPSRCTSAASMVRSSIVSARENLGHSVEHVGRSDVGHESETALVDADQGHMVSGQVSCCVEHASIASLHHDQVGTGADFIVVGYGKAADVVGSRGFLLDQHFAPLPAQVVAHRGERARDIGGVIAADQRYRLESGHTAIKS